MIVSVFDSVENIVGKGENTGFQHFLLYPQCFEKASFPDKSKGVIVWERVKLNETHVLIYIFTGKVIMHDPFAMRPFFGYNFGHYLDHWLSFQSNTDLILPKIFHVNWFRKGSNGGFLWPGFGENARVLDWIFRRVSGEDCIQESAVGYLPKEGSINLSGLKDNVDMESLFDLPKDFWKKEVEELQTYFEEQVNTDLPDAIQKELKQLEQRINSQL